MNLDIPCIRISALDVECVCCKRKMKTASNFRKTHANCVIRLAGNLTDTTRAEAASQKRRINTAVTTLLKKNIKRVWDEEGEEPALKRRIKDADATSTLKSPHQGDARNETCSSGR